MINVITSPRAAFPHRGVPLRVANRFARYCTELDILPTDQHPLLAEWWDRHAPIAVARFLGDDLPTIQQPLTPFYMRRLTQAMHDYISFVLHEQTWLRLMTNLQGRSSLCAQRMRLQLLDKRVAFQEAEQLLNAFELDVYDMRRQLRTP